VSAFVDNYTGVDVKISLSSPNRIPNLLDKGPLILTGSYWIDPVFLRKRQLNKYYYSGLDSKSVIYYDEFAGRRAGLIVYVLRKLYNKENV
jgi:hypothetical protein